MKICPNSIPSEYGTCQNAETDAIGTVFRRADRVYPNGTAFLLLLRLERIAHTAAYQIDRGCKDRAFGKVCQCGTRCCKYNRQDHHPLCYFSLQRIVEHKKDSQRRNKADKCPLHLFHLLSLLLHLLPLVLWALVLSRDLRTETVQLKSQRISAPLLFAL